MRLDVEGTVTDSPTRAQVEAAVRSVGTGGVTFVILGGDPFPYVQAARDAPGDPYVLEVREALDGPQHQALGVPEAAVVDAFLRAFEGDLGRDPALAWGVA